MPMFLINPDGSMSKIAEQELQPCPGCGGDRTTLRETHRIGCHFDTTKPLARPLFEVPPYRPDRWIIEWRWTPKIWKAIVAAEVERLKKEHGPYINPPSMYNDWQEHPRMGGRLHGYTTERQAFNTKRVLKRSFPGKQFRIRGVKSRELQSVEYRPAKHDG